MYLTREQEKMLNGEYGWAVAKALELIVKVGEYLGADKLVPIIHAHVSGISYKNIGEPGLLFIKELFRGDGIARVYTTINPGCVDLMGSSRIISNELLGKQILVNEYLEKMSMKPTYTCIPYLHRPPAPLERLAWGESNAVIIANSFYGAMTNREGGPIALAAALTGYIYHAGLQVMDNRVVEKEIVLDQSIGEELYGALGLWIGENITGIPLIRKHRLSLYDAKIVLAASAASGSHGLVVLENITPQNTYRISDKVEKISVDVKDLREYRGTPPSVGEEVLFYIGCPHLHPSEFMFIYKYLEKQEHVNKYDFLLTIPRIYAEIFSREIEVLRRKGVDIAIGTCPVVSVLSKKYDKVVTNSGKAAFYFKKIHGIEPYITSLKKIVEMIIG
ncbi:MAG: aconitase [Thermoprotei archaeon]|nr:MAG: aconitase [Thermoprotei archaeon]